jgi:hypothetical protein
MKVALCSDESWWSTSRDGWSPLVLDTVLGAYWSTSGAWKMNRASELKFRTLKMAVKGIKDDNDRMTVYTDVECS